MAKKPKLNPDLLKEFKRMAKQADTRLERLEKARAANPAENGEILQYAYKRAVRDINDFMYAKVQEGRKPRFNNLYGVNNNRQLKAKMRAVQRFIGSKSSTVKGIRESYAKRAAALSNRYKDEGLKITASTLAKIFDSGLWDKMKDRHFTSDTIFKTIAFIQKNKGKMAKQLKETDAIHFTGKEIKFADGSPTPTTRTFNKVLKDNKKAIESLVNDGFISAEDWGENPFE